MSQRMNLITSGYGVYEESYSTTCHWITFKLPHTVFDTDKKRHELCSGVVSILWIMTKSTRDSNVKENIQKGR